MLCICDHATRGKTLHKPKTTDRQLTMTPSHTVDEAPLKRTHEPIVWSLFGAGGVLSAMFGPMLILVTTILVPLGILLPTTYTIDTLHDIAAEYPGAELYFITGADALAQIPQ